MDKISESILHLKKKSKIVENIISKSLKYLNISKNSCPNLNWQEFLKIISEKTRVI